MRRIPEFRIVRWEIKVLYVVLAWIVGYVVVDLVRSIGAPVVVVSLVGLATTFVSFALAVRIFRGADEPVEPPRPWWRMTAWPTLSRRLGILFTVLAVVCTVGITLAVAGVPGTESTLDVGLAAAIEVAVTCAALAFLYLNSAVRMSRLGIVKPVPLRPDARLKF
ncbi:hypothetical protein [Agromyces sp. Marseille-Q5079]|uniref:hypothetical protein n=1 Tax=Agromyces sp. Marseille-Q5079 TaxID=3439059 RepID=UPI003D9C7FA0